MRRTSQGFVPVYLRPLACAWMLAALGAALGPALVAAQAQDMGADDPIAAVRADAQRLVGDGRFHDALTLLRAIDLRSLDAGKALEVKGWIAQIDTQRAQRLEADLRAADRIAGAGDAAGAAAVLDGVAHYGSPGDVARAQARKSELLRADEQAREAAARAREEAALAREEAVRAARAAAAAIRTTTERWIDDRERLPCSSCQGHGRKRCGGCSGSGIVRVINLRGGTTTRTCGTCGGEGILGCSACRTTGLNRHRFDDILYDVFPRSFQKQLGSRSRLDDRLTDIILGKPISEPAVEGLYRSMQWALEPVLASSEVEVRITPGQTRAFVRYAIQTAKGAREESVVFIEEDGEWYLEPPSLSAADEGDGGEDEGGAGEEEGGGGEDGAGEEDGGGGQADRGDTARGEARAGER